MQTPNKFIPASRLQWETQNHSINHLRSVFCGSFRNSNEFFSIFVLFPQMIMSLQRIAAKRLLSDSCCHSAQCSNQQNMHRTWFRCRARRVIPLLVRKFVREKCSVKIQTAWVFIVRCHRNGNRLAMAMQIHFHIVFFSLVTQMIHFPTHTHTHAHLAIHHRHTLLIS